MSHKKITETIKQTDPIEAVYIHIPFCLKKCHYCDFLSFYQPEQMEIYIQSLIKEMDMAVQQYNICAKSIFIGGGTPSCLPTYLLEQLLQAVQFYFGTKALQEYTMEANPGTLSEEKLIRMRQFGVNRLSLGVQSDQKEQLRLLGRIHSFIQAEEAVQMARIVGFTNINLDFMYGLPQQQPEQWQHTLERAVALQPQHLSLYQLKIEEGTLMDQWLQQGKIEEFDDAVALEMYRIGQNILSAHGYQQYEISNYAQPGKASLHNQVYWRTENYLGLGLGACSWVRPFRWNNVFVLDSYLQQIKAGKLPQQIPECLTLSEQMEETVFMALRMHAGLSKEAFRKRFGKEVGVVFSTAIQRCKDQGWLLETEECLTLTEQGRVLGNLVFLEFIEVT